MKGKIVFEGQTKSGEKYLIRYPLINDAQLMTEYINALSQEKTFIRFQGETITLEEETKYLQGQIDKIEKNLSVHLVVVCGNKIIGGCAINMEDKTERHVGVFGITLAHDYRGEGIGTKLAEMVIKEGVEKLPQMRIITLNVFGDNDVAQVMYKDLGFQEYGRMPEGVFRQDRYADRVYMYKKVK